MPTARIGNFRWAIGGLCMAIGATMLVVPHQFSFPVYAALQPHLTLWGVAFLAMGYGLIAVAVLDLPRWVEVGVHLFVAAGWLNLAYGFASVGGWTGASNWVAIGLAAAVAPFLSRRGTRTEGRGADLLALALGSGAALTGLTILAAPGQFAAPIYDVIRPYITPFGVAFLLGGLALDYVQIRPALPRPARPTAYFLAGSVFLAFFAASAVPLRASIGIAYYGGMGLLLWLLPWIERRVSRIDPTSLQVRLALALGSALVLSDVLVIALLDHLILASLMPDSPGSVAEVREISFVVLLVSAVVAVAVGVAAARWLAAPLGALSRASERLAAQDLSVPLPTSSVREVADLAFAFGQMRDRLAARTSEREELLAQLETTVARQHELQQQRAKHVLGISHGLRTPLTVIQGQGQLLLRALGKAKLDGRIHRSAEAIVASAQRMGLVLRDLVDLTALESGQPLKLNLEPVELRSFVLGLKGRLSGMFQTERIRLEAPEDSPPVLADPDRLERILASLLSNALKYSDPDTEVTVSFSRRDGDVAISVTDRGPGIPPDQMPHLYEPYRRTDGRPESVGLGLYVTRGLVGAMGGRIWAKSEVGKGSTFGFTLPVAQEWDPRTP